MKILLGLILITTQVSAATLGQYISKPEGSSVQSFVVEKKKVVYEKRSNFFDQKKDLSLGSFEPSQKVNAAVYEKKLESILSKVDEVDKFLRKKKSSFNELSSKKPHDSFFLLNSYRITKESDLYPEVKKIFEELYQANWKQLSGIKLTDDLKEVTTIKNGKAVSSNAFNMSFHCQAPSTPTICGYKDLGILYVQ